MTERSELRFNVVHDHDGDCSVTATMLGTFGGSGRAWLNIADISKFASSVRQLAASSKGEASLKGGYVNKDGSLRYTVNVRFHPHGSRGHILVAADLASDPPSNASVQDISKVSAFLVAEPAALEAFAAKLLNIPKGGAVEASLEGESDG